MIGENKKLMELDKGGLWIMTLASLFNNTFTSAVYPQSWRNTKLFTIFKKGFRSYLRNYKGISVTNSIA